MSFWQRILNRIAPIQPADLSRLDLLDGLTDESDTTTDNLEV